MDSSTHYYSDDDIARFSLNATQATIVYTYSNHPADAGWNQWPPKLYNRVTLSYRFTGP
jgi:hypothetical protein